MLRRVVEGLVLVVAAAAVAVLGVGRLWHDPSDGFYWRVGQIMGMPKDTGPIDFVRFERRFLSNAALACPESLCQKSKPDLVAPIFPVTASELRRKISVVALSEPNSDELACAGDCDRQARFVEYSTLFQFPDMIDVRVVEAGATASTLAIYSRSVVGYGDGNVNRNRVDRWLAALQRIMPSQ